MTKALTKHNPFSALIPIVCNTLESEHSKRAYARALRDFFLWLDSEGRPELTKPVVSRYAQSLRDSGLSASSINVRMSAIRKLVAEAADAGAISEAQAVSICKVKGAKESGTRKGNWLTIQQAQALLDAPDISTLKGLRDRAILAVLLGCGLRRAEAARLTLQHIQQREGRWLIVDLVGKGKRVRSVPMPNWCKAAMDAYWMRASSKTLWGYDTPFFSAMSKGDKSEWRAMTAQAIRDVVKFYCSKMGLPEVAPHDLRRTFAKLAHKGKSGIDQIQLSLGHASIQTTEKYLGVEQDLTDAPCDRLGLRI